MTDIALIWDPDQAEADFAIEGGDLVVDDGLRTSVLISLLTDRRARDDDPLPQAGGDRLGWWGDTWPDREGDLIGSRLWLLKREKQTPEVLNRARGYAQEALDWMVEDRVAASVEVETSYPRMGWLLIRVWITRPAGPARQPYDIYWSMT